MRWVVLIVTPLFWIATITSFLAACAGTSYLIGPVLAAIIIIVMLFLRMTWWMIPCAFVGAYFVWEWPWYGAAAIAVPGMIVMMPVLLTAVGVDAVTSALNRKSR